MKRKRLGKARRMQELVFGIIINISYYLPLEVINQIPRPLRSVYALISNIIFRFIDKHQLIDLALIYNDAFMIYLQRKNKISDDIADVLYKRFRPKSVVDFGCGVGGCLKGFIDRGVTKVRGYEGSETAFKYLLIDPRLVIKHDLRKRLNFKEKFDLAVCLEVAEHIHEDYEDIFLTSICSAANTLVFSAANIGQGGHYHINEKPPSHWVREITSRGLSFRPALTNDVKKQIGQRENLLIFTRNSTRA